MVEQHSCVRFHPLMSEGMSSCGNVIESCRPLRSECAGSGLSSSSPVLRAGLVPGKGLVRMRLTWNTAVFMPGSTKFHLLNQTGNIAPKA